MADGSQISAPAHRLGSLSGPYLRSAAHQPVNRCPWVEEAFAEAKRQSRAILLDIGGGGLTGAMSDSIWRSFPFVLSHP